MECVYCDSADETLENLFFACPVTKALWNRLLLWLGFTRSIGTWQEELQWVCNWPRKKSAKGAMTSEFAMLVAVLWRERNNLRFHTRQFNSNRLCREIAIHIHIRGSKLQKWKTTLDSLNYMP
ncbi:uncharacterized protein LOC132061454 [Lycium ferocissimum]|uniref:uncharacterized protein LOC132061454 n=1 Tax=Lycium ferocissimum TaxID=112874 RepID=UPI0028150BC8|nr:uncharacterized protein LOC132061454 [Lycium ferocissimum]